MNPHLHHLHSDARASTATPLCVRRCEMLGRLARSRAARGVGQALLFLLLMASPLLLPATASAQVPTKRVLILSGYDPNRPTFPIINRAIHSTIRDGSPGSVVWFKEPTFWENHKWYVIGVIAACIIGAPLIAWFLIVSRRRGRAERKRFAGLAEAEHRHLDEVVSNVPGIVWETLFEPGTGTRKTTFISNYVEKMLGYTPEEWLSEDPGFGYRIMPEEEDRERATRASETVIKTGKEVSTQFRWKAKDGRLLWAESHLSPIVDESGKVVGLRGVSFDITDMKLAEEALKKSEAQLAGIIGSAMDAIITVDESRQVVLFNSAAERLFGCSAAEALDRSLDRFLPERLHQACREYLRAFGKTSDMQRQMRMPQNLYGLKISGEEFPVEASISQIELNGQRFFTVILRDISERKQAELALRDAITVSERNRAQLESVFQTVTDGIVVSDMAGNLLLVNDAEARISESKSADEMKRNLAYFAEVYDFYYPGGQLVPIHEWPLSKVLRGESLTDWELRGRRKDIGREWFFSFSGEPVRDEQGKQVLAVVVTRDITERKAAEEALRQSEARFRNMADSAPVMIWVVDTDKLCTYLNKRWLDFTGRSMEEEAGSGWAEGIHADDYARCLETFDSSFDRREPFTIEYRLRRADGEFRWVFDTGTPRFSSGGDFLGYIGSCVDITDRKETEEALQVMLGEVNRLKNQLQEENVYLQEEIKLEHNFSEIVGRSDAIKYVLRKIKQVAPTSSTVLIMGETGTGKELVARAIHSESLRSNRSLVKVNCAALSPSLIESELFGHEKGAFTGAIGRKIGRFELANGATIFLDEIGELPPDLQVKLLRVIQEGELERLGGNRTIKVDARLIAATNRNLLEEVQNGRFREDLWYRLNVFPITVPPLKQRREDIPLLVEHFVTTFSKRMGKRIMSVAPATLNTLRDYSWPGNVRELANVIERAIINNVGPVLRILNISETLQTVVRSTSNKTLEEVEREHIITVLGDTSWRIEGPHGAAKILGVHPSTLRSRMTKLDVQKPHQDFVSDETFTER